MQGSFRIRVMIVVELLAFGLEEPRSCLPR